MAVLIFAATNAAFFDEFTLSPTHPHSQTNGGLHGGLAMVEEWLA
jgi:hypothetical protein